MAWAHYLGDFQSVRLYSIDGQLGLVQDSFTLVVDIIATLFAHKM